MKVDLDADSAFHDVRSRIRQMLSSAGDANKFVYDVFISYRRTETGALALKLYNFLKRGWHPCTKRHLRVFIDVEQIKGGQNFHTALKRAITGSSCFVVLLSPTYCKTEYTMFEEMLISGIDFAGLKERTLPILAEECKLPSRLQSIHYLDFTQLPSISPGSDHAK